MMFLAYMISTVVTSKMLTLHMSVLHKSIKLKTLKLYLQLNYGAKCYPCFLKLVILG